MFGFRRYIKEAEEEEKDLDDLVVGLEMIGAEDSEGAPGNLEPTATTPEAVGGDVSKFDTDQIVAGLEDIGAEDSEGAPGEVSDAPTDEVPAEVPAEGGDAPAEGDVPAEGGDAPAEGEPTAEPIQEAPMDPDTLILNKIKSKYQNLGSLPLSEKIQIIISFLKELGYSNCNYKITDNKNSLEIKGKITEDEMAGLKDLIADMDIKTNINVNKITDDKFQTIITIDNNLNKKKFLDLYIGLKTNAEIEKLKAAGQYGQPGAM